MTDWFADGSPRAEVSRVGRFRWEIYIIHGIMQCGPNGGPWLCWGSQAQADRKALRKLRAYLRAQIRQTHAVELGKKEE